MTPAAKAKAPSPTPARGARKADGGKDARNLIAAIDIGSSKVCCFIAEVKARGGIDVVGIGHQASKGVKSGTLTDLRAAESAVAHAVESAETMARTHLHGAPITSVLMNVSGVHTVSRPVTVDIDISGHDITDRDIGGALSGARGAAAGTADTLIHIIPTGYAVDGQRGIDDPRGMKGDVLSVNLTAVTAATTALGHLTGVAGQNHLRVDGFCASPYASALACISPDEAQLGCTVIDMGGGSTSLAVFSGGRLVYTAAIPIGGIHVTNDIARGLTTSLADAERIKTLYGSAQAVGTDHGSMIDVPPVGEDDYAQPHYVPRSLLTGIIQPRIEETFELARAKLVDSGMHVLAGRRVILTGGAAQLAGLCDLGQLILDKQLRLGRPHSLRGLAEATGGPAFSTAAGLLIYAAEHAQEMPSTHRSRGFFSGGGSGSALQKIKHWLKENW